MTTTSAPRAAVTAIGGVDGPRAAGRLAENPHQTAVCAGHGAEIGVTAFEDDDRPFCHGWVAPEGHFTDRGRDLPPGRRGIDEAGRRDRFAEPRPDGQVTHPGLGGA